MRRFPSEVRFSPGRIPRAGGGAVAPRRAAAPGGSAAAGGGVRAQGLAVRPAALPLPGAPQRAPAERRHSRLPGAGQGRGGEGKGRERRPRPQPGRAGRRLPPGEEAVVPHRSVRWKFSGSLEHPNFSGARASA